jgi:hypothetical protein
MPKTIHSKRDPLTLKELKAYERNKRTAKQIREAFLKKYPDFYYIKVFTEARAKGKCRTKFWGTFTESNKVFVKWFEKAQKAGLYSNCEVKVLGRLENPYIGFSLPGVAVTVG